MLSFLKREKSKQLEDQLNAAQAQRRTGWENLPEDELFTPAGFSEEQAEATASSNYSYWGSTFRAFFKNKRLAQAALTSGQVDHFQTGTGQTGVGADDIGAVLGLTDGLGCSCFTDQDLVGSLFHAALRDAVAGGGIALRIKVYDEHPLAQRRNAGRQIDGGGGFANAAPSGSQLLQFLPRTILPSGKI